MKIHSLCRCSKHTYPKNWRYYPPTQRWVAPRNTLSGYLDPIPTEDWREWVYRQKIVNPTNYDALSEISFTEEEFQQLEDQYLVEMDGQEEITGLNPSVGEQDIFPTWSLTEQEMDLLDCIPSGVQDWQGLNVEEEDGYPIWSLTEEELDLVDCTTIESNPTFPKL